MTAGKKAFELVQKITDTIFDSGNTVNKPVVKLLAIILCDEILINNFWKGEDAENYIKYWDQVKEEITKL